VANKDGVKKQVSIKKPPPTIKASNGTSAEPGSASQTPRGGVKIPKDLGAAAAEKDKPAKLIKPQGITSGKKGKDDDSDDPIAQAMALRIKAGGPTSVIS
jgi:hypothetical protein